MREKKLPIGIQTFRKIREGGCYYVDKTPLVLRLIERGKYYFLSRPRRFGKSLLLDTLFELFEGSEPLFRGLYLHPFWDWSIQYPVIRISFGEGVLHSREALDQRILEILAENERRLGLTSLETLSIAGRFSALIQGAAQHFGQRVVVLIDEYDKPILDNITRPEIAKDLRDGLRNLYSVIKDTDAHLNFAFLAGVTQFSKANLFSGLNNLNDITIDAAYSSLCGYTEEDVDTVFAPELEGLDRDQIREWYNGYNWTGEAVYNPFDLLLLFDKRQFRPYWFETGTPTFLVDVLTQRHYFTPNLSAVHASESLLSTFDVEDMPTEALLWQTGYLTFRGQRQTGARIEYALQEPNLEVKSALHDALLKGLMGEAMRAERAESRLYDRLSDNDFVGLEAHFHQLFASIPSDWYCKNPIAHYEGYYTSVFYSHFAALGLDITLEDASQQGRVDMALRFNREIYLFEFKVVEGTPTGSALQQIKDRGYAEKYRAEGRPIHLIGVEFSSDLRTVVGFSHENLC